MVRPLGGPPAWRSPIHAYIADSLRQFPALEDYHRLLRHCDFEIIQARFFYLGLLELVLVRKQ